MVTSTKKYECPVWGCDARWVNRVNAKWHLQIHHSFVVRFLPHVAYYRIRHLRK